MVSVQNTGADNGCMALTEKYLKRPLIWLVCIIHTNELPLRHLWDFLDGRTLSKDTLDGPIGKAILQKGLTELPIEDFEPVVGPFSLQILTKEQQQEFSSERLYAYQMLRAVATGKTAFENNPPLVLRQTGNYSKVYPRCLDNRTLPAA